MDHNDPNESGVPRPDAGFRDPVVIPEFELRKHLLVAGLFIGIHFQLWPSMTVAYVSLILENPVNFLLAGTYIDAQFIGVFVGITVIHEAIHVAVAEHYGFEWTAGVNWVGAYILIAEQYISRSQYMRMVLAPVVAITALAGGGIVLPLGQTATVIFQLSLLVNTAASAGDLIDYLLYRRTPTETKFYNLPGNSLGEINTYAYMPEE
ncbi:MULTISPECIES: DUF3267 domain-containing protein [Halorussus]|uniref:DUF3267 domain-containing protein n=1 Tax=Halorussus TaxID=1070314 RepID=UPI00209EDF90|nr:DUF3267 domain-containing protein [Halorussus vallis]USZ78701.1 DUF3267 domain-containing protein [Halorussus vallis]